MTAYNVVRFRVQPGMEQVFIDAHRKASLPARGFRKGALIKTGDRSYCFVGEWAKFDNIVAARPQMISLLDSFRSTLEDLGNGLGVTDPVSGAVVLDIRPPRKRTKAKAKAKKKTAKAKKRKAR